MENLPEITFKVERADKTLDFSMEDPSVLKPKGIKNMNKKLDGDCEMEY